MNSDKKRPITVEDLMRLKRVEQPPAEFWTQFDKELRAKQLAAIVARRPWWQTLPRGYGILLRHPVALGAAAALTVTVFSVNEYRVNARARIATPVGAMAFVPAASPARAVSEMPASPAIVRAALPTAVRGVAVEERAVPAKSTEDAFGQELASMVSSPMPARSYVAVSAPEDMMQVERAVREIAPASRTLMGINLAAIQAAAENDPTRNSFGFSRNFQGPAATEVSEPLAAMTSPSDERRSQMMAGATPILASFDGAAASSDQAPVSRASDDRGYESINRYGLGGDDGAHLSIKF